MARSRGGTPITLISLILNLTGTRCTRPGRPSSSNFARNFGANPRIMMQLITLQDTSLQSRNPGSYPASSPWESRIETDLPIQLGVAVATGRLLVQATVWG